MGTRTGVMMVGGVISGLLMAGCGVASQATGAVPSTTVHASSSAVSNTPSTSKTNSTPPSAESPSPTTSPIPGTGHFNPVVNQAMMLFRGKTSLTLAAPATIPISATESHWYLAATTRRSSDAYHVHLQLTSKPLSVNNPAIMGNPNQGLANDFGGFGATRYASSSQAAAALAHGLYRPQANSSANSINLGTGILGTTYSSPGLIQWQEGEWTIQLVGNPSQDSVLAKQIVQYLHTHLLPETRGVMEVMVGGDGDHTTIAWQAGSTLYQVSDYHHATGAMEMAMSMRGWPSAGAINLNASATFSTPPFAGSHVTRSTGSNVAVNVPSGYQMPGQNIAYSAKTFRPDEAFSGTLQGHPFELAIYEDYPQGLAIGVSYNHQPLYFGYGPSAVFDVLNFTGDQVVLGNPSAGTYMAVNLTNGAISTDPAIINTLKGYQGLGLPSHILGLPETNFPTTVPYG